MRPEDVKVAMSVLMSKGDSEVAELVSLTDEELIALEGIQHDQILPLPWADDNASSDEHRALVAATAMRSFAARGLITTSTVRDPRAYPEGSQEPATWEVVPELRAVPVLRRTANRVLLMERMTTQGASTSALYVFDLDGEQKCLWEVFDHVGIHLFFIVPAQLAAEQLVAFADPLGAGDASDTPPVVIEESALAGSETGQRLASARAVTSLLLVDQEIDEPRTAKIFALEDHLELMEPVDQSAVSSVRVGGISRTAAVDVIGALAELPGAGAES